MRNDYRISLNLKIYRTVILFLLIVTGVGSTSASGSGTLNVTLPGAPTSFRLWESNDGVSQIVFLNNTFECLVRYDDDHRILEPCLAVSWEVEEGGKVWAFTLRDWVYFHDGSKFTTDDVIESFCRIPPYDIKIEKIDDLRFRCILPDRRSNFLKTIVQPRYVIAKVLADSNVVGTGPFVLSEWDPQKSVKLRRFEQYWGGATPLDGVDYHSSLNAEEALAMMRKGEIDVIDVVSPALTKEIEPDDDLVLSVLEAVNICHIHLNLNSSPLNDIEFRKALNLAIDKERIIEKAYYNQATVCRGLLPPVIGGESKGPVRVGYDPVMARSIIARYIKDEDKVLKVVGLPYARPYCPDPDIVARMIIEDLENVGLKVEYRASVSMDDYRAAMKGPEYDLLISGWIIDSRDPDVFLTSLLGVDGGKSGYYSVNWENEPFTSAILQARSTVSIKKRWQFYHVATEEFFKEYPWILIAHTNQLSVHRRNINNLKISLTGEMRLGRVTKSSF